MIFKECLIFWQIIRNFENRTTRLKRTCPSKIKLLFKKIVRNPMYVMNSANNNPFKMNQVWNDTVWRSNRVGVLNIKGRYLFDKTCIYFRLAHYFLDEWVFHPTLNISLNCLKCIIKMTQFPHQINQVYGSLFIFQNPGIQLSLLQFYQ